MKMTVSGNVKEIKQVMVMLLSVSFLLPQEKMCHGLDYGHMDSKGQAVGT